MNVAEMVPVRAGTAVATTGPPIEPHRMTTDVGVAPDARGTGNEVPTMVRLSPGCPDSALGEMVAKLVHANARPATATTIARANAATPAARGHRARPIRASVTPLRQAGNALVQLRHTRSPMRQIDLGDGLMAAVGLVRAST